jgi:hypothetical protein
MPKIYRVMRAGEDGKPLIDADKGVPTLNVRVPTDIKPDANGEVLLGTKGMSVGPDLRTTPAFLVPGRLRHLRQGASGDDDNTVFSHGEGPFVQGKVAAQLILRPDKPNHGVVAPESKVPLATYRAALAATKNDWNPDEE